MEYVAQIKQIDQGLAVVRHKSTAMTLMLHKLLELRAKLGSEQALLQLILGLDVVDGFVRWANPKVQIEGAIFSEALTAVISRPIWRSRFSEAGGTPDLNSLFRHAARLFPPSAVIFDPAVGLGSSVMSVARQELDRVPKGEVQVFGLDVNSETLRVAEALGTLGGPNVLTRLTLGTMTEEQWPACDLIVAAPPLGLFLDQKTKESTPNIKTLEEYTLYRAAAAISRGTARNGAIVVTSRGWLARDNSRQLRDYLATSGTVRGLIGVPGLMSGTSIPLLVVILGQGNGETVVADLEADWERHLSGEVGDLHALFGRSFGNQS